jgi:phosphopantothenoylcysteine decarboxylase/phosphopantothenate--cysteine ligase
VLTNKTVVLGITGSIAAYKAVDIASKLTQAGAKVEVVMTEPATRFITPLTLRAITGRPVITSMWEPADEFHVEHIALAEAADVIAIVPATANIIARLAAGISDDILTCTVLASKAPVLVAPAMHTAMFLSPVTQENLARLKARGFTIVDPASGRLASGGHGVGRLPNTEIIITAIEQALVRNSDLAGRHIVVTAGGTREPIDPVRYIGNRSSGRMGYALAEAARDRGATVFLITASPHPGPSGVEVVTVETASQMQAAVAKATASADALIMAAAVADYRPKNVSPTKIKKQALALTLELVRNPEILAEARGSFIKVGFAAESENLVENARKKLETKQLDIIVANDITGADSGFAADTNKVTLVDKQGNVAELPLMTKREVADKILDRVGELLTKRR